jgi:nitroreductase
VLDYVGVNVYEAVRTRRSARGFLNTPVLPATLRRVLSAALQSPSGGNLQPWRVYVLTGSALDDLKERIGLRVAAGDPGDAVPVLPYPEALPARLAERLEDMGARRYGAVGVDRDDRDGRRQVRAGNWDRWGAGTAMFYYLDDAMLSPQWMDIGIFPQTVMLLLRAEQIDSCSQIAWAQYHRTVAEVVAPRTARGCSDISDLICPHRNGGSVTDTRSRELRDQSSVHTSKDSCRLCRSMATNS